MFLVSINHGRLIIFTSLSLSLSLSIYIYISVDHFIVFLSAYSNGVTETFRESEHHTHIKCSMDIRPIVCEHYLLYHWMHAQITDFRRHSANCLDNFLLVKFPGDYCSIFLSLSLSLSLSPSLSLSHTHTRAHSHTHTHTYKYILFSNIDCCSSLL